MLGRRGVRGAVSDRKAALNQAVTAWIFHAERQESGSAEANQAWRVVSLLEGAIAIAMLSELERRIGERGQAAAAANVVRATVTPAFCNHPFLAGAERPYSCVTCGERMKS